MTDYYSLLQVKHDVTEEDLKKAYKTLAKLWHPDKNPNNQKEATRKFKEISEAYQVLSDPIRRRDYDNNLRYKEKEGPTYPRDETCNNNRRSSRFRSSRRTQPQQQQFRNAASYHDFINADDLFRSFFGNDPFFNLLNEHHRMHDHSGLFKTVYDRPARKPRRVTPTTRQRSRSVFREPFLEFGFNSFSLMDDISELDRIFAGFFSGMSTRKSPGYI